tara:strand:- start:9714 stop:9971 length:258 start_codon:yes stop_codon:yes gene_type:complete
MTYLFNEIVPFPNAAAASVTFAGRNKGVILTNTGAGTLPVSLYNYRANGTTWENRINLPVNTTSIIPIRVWGVSYGAGISGGTIA